MADHDETMLTRRRFLGYTAAAGAVPSVGALLAACGGEDSVGSPTATATRDGATGKRGGTLRVTNGSEFRGFDAPRFWDPNNFTTSELLFNRLVKTDIQDASQIFPDLAVEVPEPENDGTSFTFTLRDATFHDGTPVTAGDVKFSIERLLNPATESGAGYLYADLIRDTGDLRAGEANESSGIVVVDERTVRFELVGPRATFFPLLALPFASILPRNAVESAPDEFNFAPIGSGPFKLDAYQSGQRAVFSRFADYFDPDSIFLDEITIELPVDPDTALLRIDRGEIDVMLDEVPPAAYNAIRNDPERKERLVTEVVDNIYYLTLNSVATSPIFQHEDARRAIAMSIDKQRLVQQLQGRVEAATGFWSPASQYSDEAYDGIPFNPEEARGLIESAGVAGMEVELIFPQNFYPLDQIGASITQDLESIGLRPQLVTLEFSNWLNRTMDEQAIVPNGWPMSNPHGSYVVNSSFTSATREAAEESGACCNFSRFSDPEVDRLAVVGLETTDKQEEIAAYQEILRIIVDKALWIPLFYPSRVHYHGENVENLVVPTNWEGFILSRIALAA